MKVLNIELTNWNKIKNIENCDEHVYARLDSKNKAKIFIYNNLWDDTLSFLFCDELVVLSKIYDLIYGNDNSKIFYLSQLEVAKEHIDNFLINYKKYLKLKIFF